MTSLTEKEKIPILLAEYAALRAQMLQRNTIINQVAAISGSTAVAIVTLFATNHIVVGLVLLIVVPPLLIFMFRLNESDMLVTAERLEELRSAVNACAGEPLLKSETVTGRSTMGYIPNFPYAVRPFDRLGGIFLRLWRRRTASN
jgi:hypothetical protein